MVYYPITPGLLGYSGLLELLVVIFYFHIFFPKFAVGRVVKYAIGLFIFLSFFYWLGDDVGARLLETIWAFVF